MVLKFRPLTCVNFKSKVQLYFAPTMGCDVVVIISKISKKYWVQTF